VKYEAKTQPTTQSVAAYLDAIDDEARRRDCKALAALMKRVTGCAPTMWGTSIVGFDRYHYRYSSGHEGDSCVVGFSARKGPISVYMAAGGDVDHALSGRDQEAISHHDEERMNAMVKRVSGIGGKAARLTTRPKKASTASSAG